MKLTAFRQSVLNLIIRSDVPQNAQALYRKLKGNTTLSSLYRALDVLEENALIQAVSLFNGTRYYGPAMSHTHYIICEQCHEIIPFEHCNAIALENELKQSTGYSITKHILTFIGLCPECKASISKQKLHKEGMA